MNTQSATNVTTIHSAQLVKAICCPRFPVDCRRSAAIVELVHRIDLARFRPPPLRPFRKRSSASLEFDDAPEAADRIPRNIIAEQEPGGRCPSSGRAPNRSAHHPAGPRSDRTARDCRAAHWRRPCRLPGPDSPPRVCARFSRSSSESAAHPAGDFGSCPVSSSAMCLVSLSARHASESEGAKARNMAADEPAKAPPLYEGDPDKSTALAALGRKSHGVAGRT